MGKGAKYKLINDESRQVERASITPKPGDIVVRKKNHNIKYEVAVVWIGSDGKKYVGAKVPTAWDLVEDVEILKIE